MLKDKFVPFLSVTPNKKFFKLFKRAQVKNILISYHYIRKNPSLAIEMMEYVKQENGLFMTDSGLFTFFNDPNFDPNNFDWYGYADEYVKWLGDNSELIFSACNLDADGYIGYDNTIELNKTHFKPLEEKFAVIYIAHKQFKNDNGIKTLKDYCKRYKYVGVSEEFAPQVQQVYNTAKLTKTAIHGLAWTKPTLLSDYPFLSVDSSSWVGYQKYGSTVFYDGKNFHQYDNNQKDVRKTLKKYCEKYKVKFYEFCHEKNVADSTHNDDEGLTFSIMAWLEVLNSIKKVANRKLKYKVEDFIKGADYTSGKSLDDLLGGEVKEAGNSEVAVYKKRESSLIPLSTFEKDNSGSLFCDNCVINDKCPHNQPGTNCVFDFSIKDNDGLNDTSPLGVLDFLIESQGIRVRRALMVESMEGGSPNKVYSQELKVLEGFAIQKANLILKAKEKKISVSKTATSEVTLTSNTGGEETKGFVGLLQEMISPEKAEEAAKRMVASTEEKKDLG